MAAIVLNPSEMTVHLLWLTAEVSCHPRSTTLASATLPSVEHIVERTRPGLPKVVSHWPLVDDGRGAGCIQSFWKAAAGELDPFILVVEGAIPNDDGKTRDAWSTLGVDKPGTNRTFDEQVKMTDWLDRLAPMSTAIVAAGTCATYGGVAAATANRGGVMGVPDYLGWNWKSKAGLPAVCVPGCPVQPDNLTETLLYLLYHVSGQAPVVPLDENLRPAWLFGGTIDEACDRVSSHRGGFAQEHRARCLAKTGLGGHAANRIAESPARTPDVSARRIATNRAKWRRAS